MNVWNQNLSHLFVDRKRDFVSNHLYISSLCDKCLDEYMLSHRGAARFTM